MRALCRHRPQPRSRLCRCAPPYRTEPAAGSRPSRWGCACSRASKAPGNRRGDGAHRGPRWRGQAGIGAADCPARQSLGDRAGRRRPASERRPGAWFAQDSPLEEAGFFTEGNELYPLPINHQVGDRASGEKRLSRSAVNAAPIFARGLRPIRFVDDVVPLDVAASG
jgi:hypothetical protein